MQLYFDTLSSEVQKEINMLLGENALEELQHYTTPMVAFFEECYQSKSQVVLILNP